LRSKPCRFSFLRLFGASGIIIFSFPLFVCSYSIPALLFLHSVLALFFFSRCYSFVRYSLFMLLPLCFYSPAAIVSFLASYSIRFAHSIFHSSARFALFSAIVSIRYAFQFYSIRYLSSSSILFSASSYFLCYSFAALCFGCA
jgi:hypothetical protein